MKNALYHQETGKTVTLLVLKENEDGTVNLGKTEKGADAVTNCVVSEDGKLGTCTIGKAADAAVAVASAQAEADKKAADKEAAKAKEVAAHTGSKK